jgi:hypothetical protein
MSKKFLLDLPDTEHQSLKLAAVQTGVSMHTFIRDAIKEKILREQSATSLHASGADDNASAVLAKASEKPT